MFKLIYLIVLPFYKLFYRPKIYGKENIPKSGGYIFVCNHFAKIDAVVFVALNKGKIHFMSKKEWFNSKFKNRLFRFLGGIPVDREKADFTSIKACLSVLKSGKPLVVFPEGTRNKINDELQEIHGGANLLAYKAEVPIVPVGMNSRFKKFGKNYLVIGKPYYLEKTENRYTSETSEKADALMREKLVECISAAREYAKKGSKK